VNWVDATGGTNAAFDFTTKGILQEALGRNELWRLVDAQVRCSFAAFWLIRVREAQCSDVVESPSLNVTSQRWSECELHRQCIG
jgi:hypothetical protein